MKRIFVILVATMTLCSLRAQVVEQGESAVVYYSPKTTVSVDIEYVVEKEEAGKYAQYAESMLGIDDAVKQNKTRYVIKDAHISTRTSADYSRAHKVTADKDVPLLLNINEKGLLVGYNIAPCASKENKTFDNKDHKKPHSNKRPLPIPEETLKAATPLAQANTLAKQIFHIRETRMYLLNGEVEHAPADGKSMELVLAELEYQEKALTELFTGKRSKRIEHKKILINPEDRKAILYFSEDNGFTDEENVEANTIVISIALTAQNYAPSLSKKKAADGSQIVYNIPGNGDVKVLYRGNELARRTVPIAQMGINVPLPKELFKGGLPKIQFSERTGNVKSITK